VNGSTIRNLKNASSMNMTVDGNSVIIGVDIPSLFTGYGDNTNANGYKVLDNRNVRGIKVGSNLSISEASNILTLNAPDSNTQYSGYIYDGNVKIKMGTIILNQNFQHIHLN